MEDQDRKRIKQALEKREVELQAQYEERLEALKEKQKKNEAFLLKRISSQEKQLESAAAAAP